jgi:hypothetical protein
MTVVLIVCIGVYLSVGIATSIMLWASLVVAKEADSAG